MLDFVGLTRRRSDGTAPLRERMRSQLPGTLIIVLVTAVGLPLLAGQPFWVALVAEVVAVLVVSTAWEVGKVVVARRRGRPGHDGP